MTPTQVKKRITSSTTTHIVTETCAVTQIVISAANPGSAWKFQMEDLSSFILIPQVTLAANTTPIATVINFEDPVRMDGGIDVFTTGGTAGEVDVWISYLKQPS